MRANKIDWRDRPDIDTNYGRTNFVSAIKSQSNVGACATFGLLGALESQMLINSPEILSFDLSEADLHFCSGYPIDANNLPVAGMDIRYAITSLCKRGVCLESYFPWNESWTPETGVCTIHKSRNDGVFYAKEYKLLKTQEEIKQWIYNVGPIQSSLITCNSFNNFHPDGEQEIYTPGINDVAIAGHAVTVVGYDDELQCWIIKNSWGTNWGYNGFARIQYNTLSLCMGGGAEELGAPQGYQLSRYAVGFKGISQRPSEKGYFGQNFIYHRDNESVDVAVMSNTNVSILPQDFPYLVSSQDNCINIVNGSIIHFDIADNLTDKDILAKVYLKDSITEDIYDILLIKIIK